MTACVLDTDVVIAALDRADAHHQAAAAAITAMAAEGRPRLLSLVTYAETLVRPAQDERSLSAALAALKGARAQARRPDDHDRGAVRTDLMRVRLTPAPSPA